jgi:hypothetical protein
MLSQIKCGRGIVTENAALGQAGVNILVSNHLTTLCMELFPRRLLHTCLNINKRRFTPSLIASATLAMTCLNERCARSAITGWDSMTQCSSCHKDVRMSFSALLVLTRVQHSQSDVNLPTGANTACPSSTFPLDLRKSPALDRTNRKKMAAATPTRTQILLTN